MVGVFLRLKLRLLANGLRGGGPRVLGFAASVLLGALGGALGFLVLAASRTNPADGAVATTLVTFALAIGWLSLPVLGFGSDETLDPTRLTLLPLTRLQLMGGLLASSCVGVAPLATAATLAGAVAGFAPAGPGAVLVVAAAVLELALCLVLSRAVVTALSAALRSRRGRDLRIVLVAIVAFLPQLLRFVRVPRTGLANLQALRGPARVLGWLPTGWAARAMAAAGRGDAGPALLEIAGVALLVAALIWWWSASLDRVTTTAEAPAGGPHRSAARATEPLFGGALAWLPRTRAGAVAAREVRYSWREPRRRVAVLSGTLLPFVALAGVLSHGGFHHHAIVYACVIVTLGAGNRSLNQFGLDGNALWAHEAAGTDLEADETGKNLSILLTTLPFVAITGVALAAASGGWVELPVALLLAAAAVGIQLAVGNVTSVRAPVPMPDNAANLWSAGQGTGCMIWLVVLVAWVIEAVLATPVVLAVLVAPFTSERLLVAALAAVYGLLLWRAGLALGARFGRGRGPELLEAVSPRRAA